MSLLSQADYGLEAEESDSDDTKKAEEKIALLKVKAARCKVITLDEMGKHPLADPKFFSNRDKGKVLRGMQRWFDEDEDVMIQEFNEVVLDKLLDVPSDYTAYHLQNGYVPQPDLAGPDTTEDLGSEGEDEEWGDGHTKVIKKA